MADDKENSTEKPTVSILIQELAQTLSDRAHRDPGDIEALEASRVLWTMAEPRSGKREKWAREARVYAREALVYAREAGYARENPAQIGPIMDRSIEAEALAETIEKKLTRKTTQARRRLTAREVLADVDAIAARIARQARISPTLATRSDVDVETVANVIRERAARGKLDVEGMAIAIVKALGMAPSVANNLYKHRG